MSVQKTQSETSGGSEGFESFIWELGHVNILKAATSLIMNKLGFFSLTHFSIFPWGFLGKTALMDKKCT